MILTCVCLEWENHGDSLLSFFLPASCSVYSTHLRVGLSMGLGSFFIDKKSLPHHRRESVCFPEDSLFILESRIIFYVIKQTILETGKMVQWLKALAVLAEDWSLVPSAHYW